MSHCLAKTRFPGSRCSCSVARDDPNVEVDLRNVDSPAAYGKTFV